VVVERNSYVGGLSATIEYKDYLFDIGGHRFYTKVSLIERLWHEVLGEAFLERPRLSRIFYNSKFFQYPLQPMDALKKLGLAEAMHCGLSYVYAQLHPDKPEDNFSSWVRNRFGDRLFQVFFKSYTEKVWGIPCDEIQAEWAAQRIKGLSMKSLILDTIMPAPKSKDKVVKTLIKTFHYPRKGPGMMWNRMRTKAEEGGCKVLTDAPVEKIRWSPGKIEEVVAGGVSYQPDQVISTLAIRDLIQMLDPAPPEELKRAAAMLRYRDFLTVALIFRSPELFPDNWIYIHDPRVKLARIQNYKNWSPEMVPDASMTCLGLEYFVQEGDGMWNAPNEELIQLGIKEVALLGLAPKDAYVDGTVVRERKAYPIYDGQYKEALEVFRRFLGTVPNLQVAGRNGMHRYNNQDHSMLTALLAARNIMGAHFDLWNIHVDEDYLEEGVGISDEELAAMESSQPGVPRRLGE